MKTLKCKDLFEFVSCNNRQTNRQRSIRYGLTNRLEKCKPHIRTGSQYMM